MSRIVLSASRRTDIPAFYMPWFMTGVARGYFEVVNPYNRIVSRVPAAPDQIHSIVFWSKDYSRFLEQGCDRELIRQGFHLFFNFSINSPHRQLEPNVPPLKERLGQLTRLVRAFSSRHVQWRFDPICLIRHSDGRISDNMDAFEAIADHAAELGIRTCITSFVDLYRKVMRRMAAHAPLSFYDPGMDEKTERIQRMETLLAHRGIALELCCEKPLLAALPRNTTVRPASCIPGKRLVQLFGPGISLKKDPGQRAAAGCGCTVSKDIGSYSLHPCRHNCLFCYANPARDKS